MARKIYTALRCARSSVLGAAWIAVPDMAQRDDGDLLVIERRTEKCLQHVPISATVSQQELTNRNIVNAADLGTYKSFPAANNRIDTDNTTVVIRRFVREGLTTPSAAVYFADGPAPHTSGKISRRNGAGPGALLALQNGQAPKNYKALCSA